MKKRKISISRSLSLILIGIVIIALCSLLVPLISNHIHPVKYIASKENVLTVYVPYMLEGEVEERKVEIPRGAKVKVEKKDQDVSKIKYENQILTISNEHLADSLEECVKTDAVYPRRLVNLRKEKGGKLSDKVVKKGEKVKVLKVDPEDLDTNTGMVKWYHVSKDGKEYFLSGQYVETSEEIALKQYADTIAYSTYWDQYFGENYSKDAYIDQIDYKPQKVADYKNNPLKTDINSVHVSLEHLINHKDYYMSLKDSTGINSFVVELKGDGGLLSYKSDVVDDYLSDPSIVLNHALMSKEELSDFFKEFQDAGYYMIARIVTFKDAIFAIQNPQEAFTDTQGKLVLHNDEYWPSGFSRKAWMYNVDIAKEIAQCNVNEIQFDYVRFPDGTHSKSLNNSIDLHNKYNESKTAALQGFLMYAKEELAPYEVYVAADLFAWPIVAQDDQDIGQFLPAIANVVDVVSPMPYTDHFSKGAMGIADPVLEPEETLYQFSQITKRTLDTIHNPAIYRTWIQGYAPYLEEEMKAQIRGINRCDYEGYMVWAGFGDPNILAPRQAGFIDSKIQSKDKK